MKSSIGALPAETEGEGAAVLEPTVLNDGTKLFELTVDEVEWEADPRASWTARASDRCDVHVRDMRNRGNEARKRVAREEALTVTRAGVPVAGLRPLPEGHL